MPQWRLLSPDRRKPWFRFIGRAPPRRSFSAIHPRTFIVRTYAIPLATTVLRNSSASDMVALTTAKTDNQSSACSCKRLADANPASTCSSNPVSLRDANRGVVQSDCQAVGGSIANARVGSIIGCPETIEGITFCGLAVDIRSDRVGSISTLLACSSSTWAKYSVQRMQHRHI